MATQYCGKKKTACSTRYLFDYCFGLQLDLYCAGLAFRQNPVSARTEIRAYTYKLELAPIIYNIVKVSI